MHNIRTYVRTYNRRYSLICLSFYRSIGISVLQFRSLLCYCYCFCLWVLQRKLLFSNTLSSPSYTLLMPECLTFWDRKSMIHKSPYKAFCLYRLCWCFFFPYCRIRWWFFVLASDLIYSMPQCVFVCGWIAHT